MKNWYTVSFQCKMDEDDIGAMNKHFYEVMRKELEISDCCALDIDSHCDQDDEVEGDE